MRPPSRFGLTILSTLFATFALAGAAFAGSIDSAQDSSPSAFQPKMRIALEDAFETAHARVDQRLNVLLSGPTRMECSSDEGTGFETCVVRTDGTPSSVPASLAHN